MLQERLGQLKMEEIRKANCEISDESRRTELLIVS